MARKQTLFRNALAMSAFTSILWLGAPVYAQTTLSQDSTHAQDYGTIRGDDAARHDELTRFGQFLDDHHEIADQLRRDPSLADNDRYLNDHPELQNFLQDHPGIREQLKQDPNAFMREEDRYEGRTDDRNRDAYRDDRDRDDHDRDADHGDRDPASRELASFNAFLDTHREIAEQVRKDPSLVDNPDFVKNHPALQAYLHDHPAVRDEVKQNPNAFMRQEVRFDRRDDGRDRDATRGELAKFDRFLDSHREIAEQLRKDPSLVDNREFVKDHPALQTYLQDHPEVREEIKENPTAFMRQEDRFDRRGDDMDRDDPHARMAKFGQFLGGHSEISQQLSQDPSLIKNQEYMENHPDLRDYLSANPGVRDDLMQNPESFIKSAQQTSKTNNGQGVKNPMPDTKPKQ